MELPLLNYSKENKMLKRYKKFYLVMTEKILPTILYFIITLSIGLEIAAQKSMGVYRDLIFRKEALENTILHIEILNIYKWIILVGIGACAIIISLRKVNTSDRVKKYIFGTMGLSIVLLIMISFYNKVSFVAYPWMVLSVGLSVLFQYIRIISQITVDY